MKKIIFSTATIALLTLSLVYTGCKKEDKDETNPVVTINGSATFYVQKGKTFSDPGATATDETDGTLTPSASGSVNTATVGTYIVTYTAKDEAGNSGTATRTVYVVDFAGSYTVTETCDMTGTGGGTSTVTISASTNNGLIIANFALAGATVTATFTGTSLTVPSQTSSGETFAATGTISGGVGSALKLNINYTQTNTGGTNTCSATYTQL
jgi:hypothetical protein